MYDLLAAIMSKSWVSDAVTLVASCEGVLCQVLTIVNKLFGRRAFELGSGALLVAAACFQFCRRHGKAGVAEIRRIRH